MTAAIEASHLRKSFKSVDVLRDVSFTVDPGTIFVLLGSNGAGKSTIVNILSTLIPPDGGHAAICGHDVVRHPALVRRAMCLTGQSAAVDAMLTARENLVLMARLRHVPEARSLASALLDDFGLADAADRRVAGFSGGMRRRLDIAMSLVGAPQVLFFDEPTTGLDPEGRQAMWTRIRSLAAGGAAIFLTTQYLEEADALADSIAILRDGKIVAEGSPSDLKALLPGGTVSISFKSPADRTAALHVLPEGLTTVEEGETAVCVASDRGMAGVVTVFSALNSAGIEPEGFVQSLPSLDDVFRSLAVPAGGGGHAHDQ